MGGSRSVLLAAAGGGLALALVAGCGTAHGVGAGAPATVTVTTTGTPGAPDTPAPTATGPRFTTVTAAMSYLATAYNQHDGVELGHVTNPSARVALEAMRAEAVDLRLVSCTPNAGRGDDTCIFDHGFPAGYHPPSPNPEGPPPDGSTAGWAEFTVAPAEAPGWYMTVLDSCG